MQHTHIHSYDAVAVADTEALTLTLSHKRSLDWYVAVVFVVGGIIDTCRRITGSANIHNFSVIWRW